ncbi:MAG: molybdopterin-dependent oxidoreductase [Nevskiaceae bacterium]|jgi:isoquinoline 1-oxidoreductase beta subunit|nr:molybdopterin-dependent oxidoreductase [Nevskiaceae bacterium]
MNIDLKNEYYPPELIEQIEGVQKLWDSSAAESAAGPVSRRGFLKASAGVGGALVLAFGYADEADAAQAAGGGGARPGGGRPAGPPFNPGAFVTVHPDGRITLISKNPEIGQGIKTAFGMILAEELDAKWSDVTVEQAPINAAVYGTQFAGGSMSIPSAFDQLRRAGAGARAMLVAAAAQQWGVPAAEITTADSTLTHAASRRSLSYGQVATRAASMKVPDAQSLKLKDRKDWKLLGTRVTGVDNVNLVTGKPLFGVDLKMPDLKVAVFQKCPATGGKVASANVDQIKALPGVVDCFIVEGTGLPTEVMPGVAIVAKNTWSAFSAKKQLRIDWDYSSASKDDWKKITARAQELSKLPQGATVMKTVGDVDEALKAGSKVVESFYTFGFIGHSNMEPQNTTAWYQKDPAGDKLEIWGSVQIPDGARTLAAKVVGVPQERSTLHQLKVGGGFGRRLMHEYACEAAQISKQAGGIPVKLMYTREDDMTHDFYRPGGFHQFKGAVDDQGKLVAWSSHAISFAGDADGKRAVQGGGWPGANDFPAEYTPNYRLSTSLQPFAIPCGPWRAPGNNTSGFLVQSFMHELAVAAGRDHAEFLLEVFGQKQPAPPISGGPPPGPPGGGGLRAERATAVIKAAVERSGWGKPLPEGHHHGLAFHFSHQGHVAEVAEVSVDANKKITVHKVTVVADIGPIVNLSGAENQCQGAVVDAIGTMALEVDIEDGRIKQQNFDTYRLPRIRISPPVEVHFLDTDYTPTGIGEPAFPPAVPAICNAVYAATGHRIRTLPITHEGFSI